MLQAVMGCSFGQNTTRDSRDSNPPFSPWRIFYVFHGLFLSTSTQWAWAAAPFVKAGQAGAMSSPEAIEPRPLSPWEVDARNLLVGVFYTMNNHHSNSYILIIRFQINIF